MKTQFLYIIIGVMVAAVIVACSIAVGKGHTEKAHLRFDHKTDVDSAFAAFKQAEGREVIPLANQLFHLLSKSETTDSLIQYASSSDIKEVTANADYWMAEYLYQTQRQKESLTLSHIAMQEAEVIDDRELQISIYSLQSAIYSRLGLFEEGLRCLSICYEEGKRTGNLENQSSDLNNMAAMFISLKEYDKAKAHIDKAIEIERPLHRDNVLAIRLGIASETYAQLGKLDEAERFAREAYQLDIDGGRIGKAAIRMAQLASVLQKKGELAEARDTLYQAMPVLKEEGNTYSYIICENQLGDIFQEEGDAANAEQHYQEALRLSEENDYKYMKKRALNGIWIALRNTDPKRAVTYLEQYTLLSDTLHTENAERELASLQAKFEYSELQTENERLEYKNHIRTLLLTAGIIACLLIITILSYVLYARSKSAIIARQTDVIISKFIAPQSPTTESPCPQSPTPTLPKGEGEKNDSPTESPVVGNLDPSPLGRVGVGLSDDVYQDAEFLNQFVIFVNNNLSKGVNVSAADCASHLCVSPRHFSRKVMAITGFTPTAYINRIKINCAKRLLDTKPDMSITEVSTRSGFEDLAYFGKMFKQIEGKTPTQYRKSDI